MSILIVVMVTNLLKYKLVGQLVECYWNSQISSLRDLPFF